MNKMIRTCMGLLSLLGLTLACSNEQKTQVLSTADLLPEQVGAVVRSSEVRTFVGESLWEYINGGAETYHQYGFIEVATAYYKLDETEITADIYRFDQADHAFGLLSSIRPPGPLTVTLGAGGFSSETSIDFIKGEYLVRLTGYEPTDKTMTAIESLSRLLADKAPGTTDLPSSLTLFPQSNRIEGSERLLAKSFLGQVFLTEVYAVDYQLGKQSVTLFLTDDAANAKLDQWLTEVGEETSTVPDLTFDGTKFLVVENSYYGRIVAGARSDKLIGIIGYSDQLQPFATDWIKSLP